LKFKLEKEQEDSAALAKALTQHQSQLK
jgi:hypothetical protein